MQPTGRPAIRLEDHAPHLTGVQRAGDAEPAPVGRLHLDALLFERARGRADDVQREPGHRAVLHGRGEGGAVLGQADRVPRAGVVEPWLQVDHEPHGPPDDPQLPDDAVPVGDALARDRHEIVQLADAVRAHEAGDEHRRVRQVQLLGDVVAALGRDLEVAALVRVEQRREHAGRIEPRTAEPVDRAVGGHEGGGLQVADHSVIADVRVALSHAPMIADPPAPCGTAPVRVRTGTPAACTAPRTGRQGRSAPRASPPRSPTRG